VQGAWILSKRHLLWSIVRDITNAGTLQTVSEYIFRHKMNATSPSTALDDFFGTGMTIVYFLLTSKKKFLHNAYFVDIMVYSFNDLRQVSNRRINHYVNKICIVQKFLFGS
jgi:hypothetical protein